MTTGLNRPPRARRPLLVWLMGLTVLALIALSVAPAPATGQTAGSPLLPDLRTLPPAGLRFDVVMLEDKKRHHVLRFDNTVWNAGPGRLELEGAKRSKISQNLYDAPVGGSRVQQLYLGNDSVFHRAHNHYHLENFATYLLLAKAANGSYGSTTSQGSKTSFCIIDTTPQQGSYPAQYTLCDQALQGLTVGWGDTYGAHLADQWVELGVVRPGSAPLADGEYALQSTANPALQTTPRQRLLETDYANNMAVTYFSVRTGVITNVRTAP